MQGIIYSIVIMYIPIIIIILVNPFYGLILSKSNFFKRYSVIFHSVPCHPQIFIILAGFLYHTPRSVQLVFVNINRFYPCIESVCQFLVATCSRDNPPLKYNSRRNSI